MGKRPWLPVLAGIFLLAGCRHQPPPPPPPSAELQAADADKTTPLTVLLPRIVTLALQGTPYANRVQCNVLPVPGTSGDLWMRLHLTPTGGDPQAQQASVRQQTLDLLGRILVPLKHKATHRISCQISANEVPVEVDEVVPDSLNLADLKLGDVVPPERISPQLKVSEDHWDRLRGTVASGSPRNL